MTKPHQPDPPEPYYDSQPSPAAPSVPHSIEAEEAVIGSILINPEVFYEVLGVLAPKDFYIHRLRWIFEVVNALIVENGFQTVDLLTVADRLEREGQLAEIGGPSYLTALCTQVPTSLNVLSYAKIVEEHSIRRHMIEQANALANLAYDIQKPIDKVTTDADAVLQTRPTPSRTTVVSAKEAIDEFERDIQAGIIPAIPTSLPLRNKQFGGYPIGLGTLLNGDSQTGKTAIALQDCESHAMAGGRALYVTTEELSRDMVARRAFGLANMSRTDWRRGLTSQQIAELKQQAELYRQTRKSGLFFDHQARSVSDILRSVRQCRPELLVVDDLYHVSLHSNPPGTNETLALARTFVMLKDIVNSTSNCALVVIHHFTVEEAAKLWPGNKGNPDDNYPPSIDNLAWSKGMRYAIDLWLSIVPDFQADIKADKTKIIEWVMKDKAGQRLGSTELMFDKVRQWFDDHSTGVFSYSPKHRNRAAVTQPPILSGGTPLTDPNIALQDVEFNDYTV